MGMWSKKGGEKYMKVLNQLGEQVCCKFCKKPLTTNMQLEYSEEISEIFCSPDCAITYYFEYMRSKLIEIADLKGYGFNIC